MLHYNTCTELFSATARRLPYLVKGRFRDFKKPNLEEINKNSYNQRLDNKIEAL